MFLISLILLSTSMLPVPPQETGTRTAAEWDRVALVAGAQFDTDAEMLAWLRALELEESDRRRRELGRLAATRERLRVTVRHDVEMRLMWLELSPDGSLLATSDDTLRVWDAHTGALLWETRGKSPRFTGDGRYLASVWLNEAALRDARTGRLVSAVRTAPETVIGAAIPETSGALLATIGGDPADDFGAQLTLWDLAEGSVLAGPVPLEGSDPGEYAFDPTGRFFAATFEVDNDHLGAYLWSKEEGLRRITPLAEYWGWSYLSPLAFDSAGERLAVVVAGGEARVFSTNTSEACGEPLPLGWCDSHLTFRDDDTLAASSWGQACLWDLDARAPRSAPRWKDDLDSYLRDNYSNGPDDLSPDGTRHALGGLADTLRIWSTATGAPIGAPLRHGIRADLAAFAADDRTVASGSRSGLVRVWDVVEGDPGAPPPVLLDSSIELEGDGVRVSRREGLVLCVEIETGAVHEIQRGGRVTDLTFDREGGGLAVAWENGEIDRWSPAGERIGGPLRQCEEARLAWRGKRLVAMGKWGLQCWNLETGASVSLGWQETLPALSVDGEELVCAWYDRIQRWSTGTWTRLSTQPAPEDSLFGEVDPEGRRVVRFGFDSGPLALVDTRSGVVLAETSAEEVGPILFGDDGSELLWALPNDDGDRLRVSTWEPASGAPPRSLSIEADEQSLLAWHSSSKLLAISRRREPPLEGDAIHLLDADDGSPRGDLLVAPGDVTHLLLDPIGKWLAVGCGRMVDELLPLSWAATPASDPPTDDDEPERMVLARAPGGDLVAVIDEEGRLELWGTGDQEPIARHSTHPGGDPLAIAPDGTLVRLLRRGRALEDVDPVTGACFSRDLRRDRSRHPWSVAIDARTGERAILFEGGTVDLYDADSGLRVKRVAFIEDSPDLMALGGAGRLAAFSRKGEVVVTELAPASAPLIVESGQGLVTALALDRAGDHLAVGDWSGEVHLFGLRSPEKSLLELSFDRPVGALAFGAEGELAVATVDGAVRVVDRSGRVARELESMDSGAAALSWTGAGELVALGQDGRHHSWNARGEVSRSSVRLDREELEVIHVAFDRTGTRLAVAHRDRSIAVWELEEWRLCGPSVRAEAFVEQLRFGTRSDRLIVGDENGYSTYDVETGERLVGPTGARGVLHGEGSTLWVGQGWPRSSRYRVLDLESGEVLWQASEWERRFFDQAGPFDSSGERLLVNCMEYATLLKIVDGEVTALGTRRRPVGNEAGPTNRFLDDGRVLAGVRVDVKPAELTILDFDDPGDVRLEGDASELRRIWEPRLGLRIVGDEIVR